METQRQQNGHHDHSHYIRSIREFFRREYGGNFWGDLSGGMTAAIVALPLALAFAVAAGAPARYGLYTSIVAGFFAAVFGGSPIQISGPSGTMAAVLIAVTIQYGYEKIILIALMAGLIQIAAGVLQLGRLVKMLPVPLVVGFTLASAIVIFGGQIDHAFGMKVFHMKTAFYDRLVESLNQAWYGAIQPAALVITSVTVVIVMALLRVSPRIPAALIAVIVTSVGAWLFDAQVPYVIEVPRVLPAPHFPPFSWEMFRELLRPAATVAALGSIESLLSAVVSDQYLTDDEGRTRRHNSNRELIGQGISNLAVSFFSGIPSSGAVARTTVSVKSGGRTRLAAVTHSLTLLAMMAFVAPLATRIPIASLAGVIIVVAIRMTELKSIQWVLRAPRSDIAIFAITVLVTVFTDLVLAVEFGLATASILFIRRMSEARLYPVRLETDKETSQASSAVRVFRLPGPLFWGDSHLITRAVDDLGGSVAGGQPPTLLLKMQLVSYIDASGAAVLRAAAHSLRARGGRLVLTNTQPIVMATLQKMGVVSEIGEANIFPSFDEARLALIQATVPKTEMPPAVQA